MIGLDQLGYLALIVVTAPLLAAIVVGLGNKKLPLTFVNWLTCGLMAISFAASLYIAIGFLRGTFTTWDNTIYVWGQSGTLQIPVGFLLDRLTALMITVVTFVSLMVHVYSIGYMHDDPGYQRFFCYISLFTFAMLMLVMANNFAQLFFGWEAVGLLSYLLIGFWYQKGSANFASLKAFLVNRVGDLGFIIAIAAILFYFDTLQYTEVFTQFAAFNHSKHTIILFGNVAWSATTFICICLFIGAVAKSAQVPLHVWLPDSMEGPTPISALIHAATMVTAGIFMVARMSPLFEHSEVALTLMLVIGSITCLLMAILAVVQTDIKQVVAYSTLSQLGYMVVALGVSAYTAAIFHLFTHAFFKALLFLGAGSAILAMHHDQNIFNMGNLRKYMPITAITMLIGSLALAGFPGTSGFYSKDLIIAATHNSKLPFSTYAYQITLITVFITALYSFRLFFVVFCTEERMPATIREHLHESPKVVWIPLVLLAIPTLIIGMPLVGSMLNNFFGDAIFVLPQHDVLAQFKQEDYHSWYMMLLHGFISLPFLFMLLGFVVAWLCYVKYPLLPSVMQQDARVVSKVLAAKYGFDAFNEKIIVPAIRGLGQFFWRVGDVEVIDHYMVNGSARNINRVAVLLRYLQTGYLYHYIFIMIAGLLALIIWIMYL